MKKSIIYETAETLLLQLKVVQKANESDLVNEAKRMDSMSNGANSIAGLADKEVKFYLANGFLPENNTLVNSEDLKLVNYSVSNSKKRSGLLIDEFSKK